MIFDTPIDYSYPPDRRAELLLRAIQDRERRFQRTFTSDLYAILSGIPNDKVRSTNQLKHEWIDRRIGMLAKMNFIERLGDEKDRRRIEIRTKPEEIYTYMIGRDPMLFWKLIERNYFYFIVRFAESGSRVICPKCQKKSNISIKPSKKKVSRYVISEDMHIDVILTHLDIEFKCECGRSYSKELNTIDPSTMEDFSRLMDVAKNRRNLR